MDPLSFIGFALGFGLLYFGASEGGGLKVFINSHGICIVVGGTLAMTLVNSSARNLWMAFRGFFRLFFPQRITPPGQVIVMLRQLSDRSRSEGMVALQDADRRAAVGFLARAANVALMSGDPEFVRVVLDEDILQMKLRHQVVGGIFRTMGVISPMIGLLGTLIGIVNVLQHITDPTKVGPSMATALSTAFYGILISSFFAIPVAGKLRERSNDELLVRSLIVEGIVGILKKEPSYLLELRLRSFARQQGIPVAGAPIPEAARIGA
jgi:chemotaxis protein MotA